MAKNTAKKTMAPSQIVLKLNAPGMTAMHRVGLGGLAATLMNLSNRLKKKDQNRKLFSSPLWHDDFSWEVQPTEIIIFFGKPEWAGDFFHWLFDFAFQIDDNRMIFLPGQLSTIEGHNSDLPAEVNARLQNGLTLTFLQHGGTRELAKEETQSSYEYDNKKINFAYKECLSYTHQTAWEKWINKKGELALKNYDVQGPINPGTVVRHQAFAGPTRISQPIELVLPLVFAIVGAVSLPINRGVGVLVVPYVEDLTVFARMRQRLTPEIIIKTYIASAGDAVLRFESECRSMGIAQKTKSFGCDVITFRSMPWATQQKLRSTAFSVTSIDNELSEFYHKVLQYLPPRIRERKNEIKTGRGKDAVKTVEYEYFWADSVIRPFIADNIVLGKYWFTGFTALMNSTDPSSGKPMREKIAYERERLNQMIKDETLNWKLEGARSLVLAVQEALRCCYGKAGSDSRVSETGKKNRLEKEYEKWRLAFSGAKTEEQFRYALGDMFSRARNVPELKTAWEAITKLLLADWQSARDLALIGLASYKGKENTDEAESDPSTDE